MERVLDSGRHVGLPAPGCRLSPRYFPRNGEPSSHWSGDLQLSEWSSDSQILYILAEQSAVSVSQRNIRRHHQTEDFDMHRHTTTDFVFTGCIHSLSVALWKPG
eukprot:3091357-Rhodomonas_salina.1